MWFPTAAIIRQSQPSLAGVGAWADIGKKDTCLGCFLAQALSKNLMLIPADHPVFYQESVQFRLGTRFLFNPVSIIVAWK